MEYANDSLIRNIRISMLKMIEPSHKLEEIIGKFSKDQLRLIMENVGAIQLTEGCNSCCPDCGLGALPKVRDYIPFDFLKYLFSEFKAELHTRVPFLYYASEPFDYNDGVHTYIDVHGMFEKECEANPCVITSIPRGWEKTILEYVLENNSLGNIKIYPMNRFVDAISITRLNYKRIENAFQELIHKPELEKQLRMNCFSYSSFSHIFDYISSMGIDVRDYRKPNQSKQIHDKRLGPNNINNLANTGMGCFHGVLITPKGISNLQTIKPFEDYPYGQRVMPINPDNFSVAKYYRFPYLSPNNIVKESEKFRLISTECGFSQ